MPEVPMVATRDFTYSTRRLKAGDTFGARNSMDARILERVRRVAELGKPEEPMERVRQVVAPQITTEAEDTPADITGLTEPVEKPKTRKRRAKAKK